MATIQITDSTAAVASISLVGSASAFEATPAAAVKFVESEIVSLLDQPIDLLPLASLCLGFTYTPSFKLDANYKFSIGGSLNSSFTIFRKPLQAKPGESAPCLFPNDPLGDDPLSLSNHCYTALQFDIGLNSSANQRLSPYALSESGNLKASSAIYRAYSGSAGYPTLKTSLVDAFSSYAIPASRAGLLELPPDQIFTYEISGSLKATGKFNLLAAINPTVSAGITETLGPVSVQAGPAVTLGGCITITSDFQIRARKLTNDILRIGHYRKKGATLSVNFDAGASATATVGGVDLIAPIYKLLGSGANITKAWFEQQGAKDLADKIQEALTQAVQQKLSIALDAETDATACDTAAFIFDFHLPQLDASGLSALDGVLAGDLSALVTADALPTGITKHASALDRLRSTTHTLSVNFLGVLSYADVEKYALESTARYTEGGEIAMIDKATASDIVVTDAPLMASQQLHHVLADLFTATISYHCIAGKTSPDFTATQQFYDFEHKIDAMTLGWFGDLARQLGKPHALANGPSANSAWMNILLTYQKKEAVLLLLDAAGHARPQSDFIGIGRRATIAAVELNPVVNYLAHMRDGEPYWDAILNQDPGTFLWPMNTLQKKQFGMACFAVNNWAAAMAKLSKLIEQILVYTSSHDGATLSTDPAFLALRSQLAAQLKQTSSKLVGSWVPAWSTFAVYFCHPPSSGQISLGLGRQGYTDTLP
jgi:hypothetical protein